MNEITKNLINKISSYDILNNLLPGAIFCYIIKNSTRIIIPTEDIFESIVIYYFVGMIISRIGSLYVERTLRVIKVRNKITLNEENFLDFAPYEDYIEASKDNQFLQILNEKNNIYRTISAMLIMVIIVKLYDCFFYDWVNFIVVTGSNFLFIFVISIITMLFIQSYRKQTNYIKSRVEKYLEDKQKEEK